MCIRDSLHGGKLVHNLAQRGLAAHGDLILGKTDAQRILQPLGDDQRSALNRIDKGLAINGDTCFLILRDNALIVEEVALDQDVYKRQM